MFDQLFASKKNPRFKQDSQWDKLRFDLSGCQLEISLPPQDYDFPEDPLYSRVNLFDSMLFEYEDKPDKNGYEAHFKGIAKSALWNRHWFTYGSLFIGGHIGTLQCSATVIDVSRMKDNLNCFNPKQFERLILHDLYYCEGPGAAGNEYTAPVNWQVIDVDNVKWVYTEAWPRPVEWQDFNDPHKEVNFVVSVSTPLYEDKYLSISFYATGSLPPEPSNELMFERVKKIVSAVKLQLSIDGEKQKTTILETGISTEYSTSREPENWKYYGSYRRTEDGMEFEGECTPPPKLS